MYRFREVLKISDSLSAVGTPSNDQGSSGTGGAGANEASSAEDRRRETPLEIHKRTADAIDRI
eukprot:IDg6549t1